MDHKEPLEAEDLTDSVLVTRRVGRQLPSVPSKIPVRREQSLPSSGRSTPCMMTSSMTSVPGLQREASSPPGMLFTGTKPRPPLAPKPSLNIMQRSAPGPASPAPVTSPGAASKIPRPRNNFGMKKWDSTSALEVSCEKHVLRKSKLMRFSSAACRA